MQKVLVHKGRQLEIPSSVVAISFSSGFFHQLSPTPFLHFSFPGSPVPFFLPERPGGEQLWLPQQQMSVKHLQE